jgi:hypothetical protein
MNLRIQLLAAAALFSITARTYADNIYCVSAVSADKTNVCVNEAVNISIDSTICSNGQTVWAGNNYSTTFATTGIHVISNWCSACGEASSLGLVAISVGQLNGISPSSATMCPGSHMVFTAIPSNAIPCGPVWSLSASNAGTLSSLGNTATFTLSRTFGGSTVTLTAACGAVTSTATITVATSGLLSITNQPVSRVSCPSSNVTFSVAATGSSPLFYQWRWNGMSLTNLGHFSGVTNSTLTISNIFAPTSVSNSIPANNGMGAVFPSLVWGDLYTYRATGCATVTPLLTADPQGDTYTNGNCTGLLAGPTPDWAGCNCPGLAAYALVGKLDGNCVQFGTNGQFQELGSGPLRLLLNDNYRPDNSGSWEATLTHTIEGVYDCIVSNSCGAQISAGATLDVSTPCDGIPDSWRMEYFDTTNATGNMCASCYYTNSALDNLQDYDCGLDPLVPIVLTTPTVAYSGMTGYVASVTGAGTNVNYSWSITNGTITAGINTTTATWTAGNAGTATLSVTLSNSPSCIATISTNIFVGNAYYVDYTTGNDTNNSGTNAAAPWKHCPGDPSALRNSLPGRTTLNPGDTVLFKGGVSYVLTATNGSIYTAGIAVQSGSTSGPITYDGQSWTGAKANLTDDYSSNSIIAFATLGGGMANVIIKGFDIGPIGGSNSLPTNYSDTNLTTITQAQDSTNTSPLSVVGSPGSSPCFVLSGNGCNSYFLLKNSGSSTVLVTSVTCLGSGLSYTGPQTITNLPSSSSYVAYFCFTNVPASYGQYTGAVVLVCNNGQILTNTLIGINELPAKPGWGVWSEAGPATNVSVLNCDFHDLGYWQDSKPMGPDSLTLLNEPSPAGVAGDGFVNCVISNCTFTKVHTGIELGYVHNSISNLTVAACNIHDYVVWGIDLASSPSSPCADYIFIHDNQIHDIGWYYGAGWTGYTDAGGSDQHQDPIFDRLGNGGYVAGCNGTNIDIFNNTFYDSEHTDSVATGYVSLEGGVSANIYNNLFNLPNFAEYPVRIIDDIPAGNALVRFLNNTVVFSQQTAIETDSGGDGFTNSHYYIVMNNLFYDYSISGGGGNDHIYAWTSDAIPSSWTNNYNLYYEPYNPGSLLKYGLTDYNWGTMQSSFGYDTHSTTNNPTSAFASLVGGNGTLAWQNSYSMTNGPAIGAGIDLSFLGLPGLGYDITGKQRTNFNNGSNDGWDIGAYQH